MTSQLKHETQSQVNENDGRLRIPLRVLWLDKRLARHFQKRSVSERNLRAQERNSYIIINHALGVSPRILAAETGVHISTVYRVIKRQRERLIRLWEVARERLARALNPLSHLPFMGLNTRGKLDRDRFNSEWASSIDEKLNVHIGVPQPYRCQDCRADWYDGAKVCPYCGWALPSMFCNFWWECRKGGERGKSIWQEMLLDWSGNNAENDNAN